MNLHTPTLIQPLAAVAAAAALMCAFGPAHAIKASTGGDAYVERIDISGPNPSAVVTLHNTSGSKMVDQVELAPNSATMKMTLSGYVKCNKDKKIEYSHARAYFGPVLMNGGMIDDAKSLFSAPYDPSFTVWDGVGNGKWNTESGNGDTFDVPLQAVRNGPANVGFDPVAEFNQRLEAHLAKGGKRLDFMKQSQEFIVARVVSLGGWCEKEGNARPQVNSAFLKIKVRYTGQPDLIEPPKLNAQVDQNTPTQINQDLPMILNTATFQPNMPHHIGACPPAEDPMIRVNYSGAGKGRVRFMIQDVSTVYGTADIAFDSTKGPAHFDFAYPLKSKLASKPQWKEVNQTFEHNLVIRAKYRDEKSDTWSDWKDYGSAVWKHRCTPSLNVVPVGGAGGMGAKLQQPGEGTSPAPAPLGVLKAPVTPKPVPVAPNFQAPPTMPKPTPVPPVFQPAQPTPTPAPLGVKAPQTVPTPTPRPLGVLAPKPVPPRATAVDRAASE